LVARTGTHVAVELISFSGQSERLEFDIVPDRMADLAQGFLGEGTPLAKALVDQPTGTLVPYHQADISAVRIISVTEAQRTARDVQGERDAALRRARQHAERTNAILFASSFSGKWGDYDPEGMDNWDQGNDAGQA
jgi:hypothetical protein